MRKLLGTVVVIGLVIFAVGYGRGWFTVSGEDQQGNTNVEMHIDKEKVKEDAQQVAEKAEELGEEVGHVIHEGAAKAGASGGTSQP
ncbi:MAG: hypothetical protein P8N76_22395 [Pirellulaceae bacterium]|nr:hypothetical protein [Pirellulaceae bacterium]